LRPYLITPEPVDILGRIGMTKKNLISLLAALQLRVLADRLCRMLKINDQKKEDWTGKTMLT
jgi:hypothetical protein